MKRWTFLFKTQHPEQAKETFKANAGRCEAKREIMEHRGCESTRNPKEARDGIGVSEWERRISSLNSQQWHILENWSKTENMLKITGTEEGLNQTLLMGLEHFIVTWKSTIGGWEVLNARHKTFVGHEWNSSSSQQQWQNCHSKRETRKVIKSKNKASGLHSNNICDHVNISTMKNESCLHSALKIPLGGIQREKWAEGLQGWRNPSSWVWWTNRIFLIATNL